MNLISGRSALGRLLWSAVWLTAAAQAAVLTRLPYLQNVGSDHASVLWATADQSSGVVEFTSERGDVRTAAAVVRQFPASETGLASAYFQYRADLTGLEPGALYSYRVLSDGQDVTPDTHLSFRTAGPGPFRFLALGDSGTASAQQLQLAGEIEAETGVSLVVHVGDIAYPNGTFAQFQANYFDVYAPLMERVPFFPALGNHEYYTRNGAPYLAVNYLPSSNSSSPDAGRYYSFDWGDAHFVSLDSNLLPLTSGANMLTWLDSDLRQTRRYWKIVYFHHPPYPTGYHVNDAISALAREEVVPILERYGVQLVLSGHEHAYERSLPLEGGQPVPQGYGTVYIITGGGGAARQSVGQSNLMAFQALAFEYLRVDVAAGRLVATAIGLDGGEIDSVTLTPAPQLASGGIVNSASFTPPLAPGSLVTLFGQNLAFTEQGAAGFPLPAQLVQTSVAVDGHELPLLYVSPGQINAQLPYGVNGALTLKLVNPDGAAEAQVSVDQTAPAVFNAGSGPAVVHVSGNLVSATSPAAPSETIVLFVAGLGAVNGDIAAGQAAPDSPLFPAAAPDDVRVGNLSVKPSFAGLTPRFAGLYQINFQVPATLTPGTYPLRVFSQGSLSNTVYLPVGGPPPAP